MKNDKAVLVCFTGSQGVGKTTTLKVVHQLLKEHLPNLKICLVDEVVRTLIKKYGIANNKEATIADQLMISLTYVTAIQRAIHNGCGLVLSDRSSVCIVAYANTNPHFDDTAKAVNSQVLAFLPDLLFYIPIESSILLKADGVRSVDVEYQKRVDEEILCTLAFHKIKHHIIREVNELGRGKEMLKTIFSKGYFPQTEMSV